MKPEMNLDKIATLTRAVVGDKDGRRVCDEKAALRLIGAHIPELCAVIAEREKEIARLADGARMVLQMLRDRDDVGAGAVLEDLVAAVPQ